MADNMEKIKDLFAKLREAKKRQLAAVTTLQNAQEENRQAQSDINELNHELWKIQQAETEPPKMKEEDTA